MIRIELTKQEAQALAGLIDAAVRSLGLRAAKDATILAEKLDAAMQAHETTDDRPAAERLRDGARSSAA